MRRSRLTRASRCRVMRSPTRPSGEHVEIRSEALEDVGLTVDQGFQQPDEDEVSVGARHAQQLVRENAEGVRVGVPDGDEDALLEDEGDFRDHRLVGFDAAQHGGRHEAPAVFAVEARGGLNFAHLILGGHFDAAEFFGVVQLGGAGREQVNPENVSLAIVLLLQTYRARDSILRLGVYANHGSCRARGIDTPCGSRMRFLSPKIKLIMTGSAI